MDGAEENILHKDQKSGADAEKGNQEYNDIKTEKQVQQLYSK